MKTFLTFTLICIISATLYSQEIPKLNFGVGYPFFIPKSNYSYSGGYIFIEKNKLNLFAEIPGFITFKKIPEFMISPGLSFIYFNETQESGALGGSGYTKYQRHALSIYSKFMFMPEIKFVNPINLNFGILAGNYLYTQTSGYSEWSYYAQNWQYHGSSKTDTDGKSYFKSFYFGFTSSFQFNFDRVRNLKPGIEFIFYPDFVNIFDHYSGDTDNNISHSMFMGSIILGIGSKKLSNESKKIGLHMN